MFIKEKMNEINTNYSTALHEAGHLLLGIHNKNIFQNKFINIVGDNGKNGFVNLTFLEKFEIKTFEEINSKGPNVGLNLRKNHIDFSVAGILGQFFANRILDRYAALQDFTNVVLHTQILSYYLRLKKIVDCIILAFPKKSILHDLNELKKIENLIDLYEGQKKYRENNTDQSINFPKENIEKIIENQNLLDQIRRISYDFGYQGDLEKILTDIIFVSQEHNDLMMEIEKDSEEGLNNLKICEDFKDKTINDFLSESNLRMISNLPEDKNIIENIIAARIVKVYNQLLESNASDHNQFKIIAEKVFDYGVLSQYDIQGYEKFSNNDLLEDSDEDMMPIEDQIKNIALPKDYSPLNNEEIGEINYLRLKFKREAMKFNFYSQEDILKNVEQIKNEVEKIQQEENSQIP